MAEKGEGPKPIVLPDGRELVYDSIVTGAYSVESYSLDGNDFLKYPPLRRQIDTQRKAVNAHFGIPGSGIALDINCSTSVPERRFCSIDISDGKIDAPVVHAVYKFGKLIKAKIIDGRELDSDRLDDYVNEDINRYKNDYLNVSDEEIFAISTDSSERYQELNDRVDPMAVVDFRSMKIKYYEKEKETIGVTAKEENLVSDERYGFFGDIYKCKIEEESVELTHDGDRGVVVVRLPKQLPFNMIDNLVDVNSQKWAEYGFVSDFSVTRITSS